MLRILQPLESLTVDAHDVSLQVLSMFSCSWSLHCFSFFLFSFFFFFAFSLFLCTFLFFFLFSLIFFCTFSFSFLGFSKICFFGLNCFAFSRHISFFLKKCVELIPAQVNSCSVVPWIVTISVLHGVWDVLFQLMFTPHEHSCLRVKWLDNHTQDHGRSLVHTCRHVTKQVHTLQLQLQQQRLCFCAD